MLKRLIWISCFCLPLLSVGAQGLKRADAAQSKAMIERINKTASGIRSIDCQFTQVKTLRFLDDEMTSEDVRAFIAENIIPERSVLSLVRPIESSGMKSSS